MEEYEQNGSIEPSLNSHKTSSGAFTPMGNPQNSNRKASGQSSLAEIQSFWGRHRQNSASIIGLLALIGPSVDLCQGLILASCVVSKIGKCLRIKSCVATRDGMNSLKQGVHIVVGAPGTMCNMIERQYINTVRTRVLDETEELISRGFSMQIQCLIRQLPGTIQFCVASAAMSRDVLRPTMNSWETPPRS